MLKYLICGCEINEDNKSNEHIIPNAIGGKLKCNFLVCKKHNSEYGQDSDAKLADDLNIFSVMLGIKRERGTPKPILTSTKSGKKYLIESGGKPSLARPYHEEKQNGNQIDIKIEASNLKQARQVLEGLKRKYPSLDVDAALATLENRKEYLTDELKYDFSIGGPDSYRCIARIIVNFLLFKYPKIKDLIELKIPIDFIKGENEYDKIFYYYPDKRIFEHPKNSICHSILIKSYSKEKLLVGILELFETVQLIMILSENYEEEIEFKYSYDLITRKEIDTKVYLPMIEKEQLNRIFANKPDTSAFMRQRFSEFMQIATGKQRSENNDQIFQTALENSLMKYPEGIPITQEMINELVGDVMKELTPLIVARSRRKINN